MTLRQTLKMRVVFNIVQDVKRLTLLHPFEFVQI